MDHSLFVERHESGLSFYIKGNLQFNTADEALYHEYLVVPALALAVQRFPNQPLRVLICGGGDGLAARDVLRFPQVRDLTLVDYDPEVLALARSEFVPYNQGSLLPEAGTCLGAERVTIYTQDAYEFVQRLPDDCYHVVIGDFTCPTHPGDLAVFSLEWFRQIRRILVDEGLFTLNGVSTSKTPTAFWCLYQTLFATGFAPKPMNLSIPSFQRLDYGNWGFLLSSTTSIQRAALEQIELPEKLRVLTVADLLAAFQFPEAIASHRHNLNLNTLAHPHLFYYLLNPPHDLLTTTSDRMIDFLSVEEEGTGQISEWDELQLEAIAQRWLAQLNPTDQYPDNALIPVQHYHQTPSMTREWLAHAKNLLGEIDPQQLITQLLARSQELPPKIVQELKGLLESLRTGQPLVRLSAHTTELMTVLTVTLIMASLATPDAAYAKGSSSGFHSGSSSSGGNGYYGSGYHGSAGYDPNYSAGGSFGWIGFWMTVVGGIWLWGLNQNQDES